MKTKWTKAIPPDGWHWIMYKGKLGMVKCPCEIFSVGHSTLIKSARNDTFLNVSGDGNKVTYAGVVDKSVRFGPPIPVPE